MSTMFFIQFAIVLLCILIGAQVGGIGLGVLGGVGLAVLAFGFHLEPTSPPIDVMLMIMAVVSAAASMQASGGLDYMIKIATRVLHRNPKYITFIAPAVTYLFTVLAGTGHVAYSVLPVIAEVSRRNGIRPSRPLTMAVIASQFAIVASPIAAAVVACVTYLEPQHITMADVLKVTVPSTILGIGLACVFVNKLGKELKDDPHYQKLLAKPRIRQSTRKRPDGTHQPHRQPAGQIIGRHLPCRRAAGGRDGCRAGIAPHLPNGRRAETDGYGAHHRNRHAFRRRTDYPALQTRR